jgi:hypothetical protein
MKSKLSFKKMMLAMRDTQINGLVQPLRDEVQSGAKNV